MASNFNLYSKYYNLIYSDKNYNKEVDYIASLFDRYGNAIHSVLEIGSGTGGHGLILQKKGYDIFGIELSQTMADQATRNGFPCIQGSSVNFELKKEFDAVISLFHVFSYLTSNEDLIASFKNAHKHLKKEGLFIFDAWYSPAVYEQRALPRIKKMENEEISITRFANPIIDINRNTIDIQFSVFAKDLTSNTTSELFESHPMRHFSLPEIELIATFTGFELLKAEEFVTSNTLSDQTWGACFILKKK
jgi:SAM-dependent methyltransferase